MEAEVNSEMANLSSRIAIRKKASSVFINVGFGTHMVGRSTCNNIQKQSSKLMNSDILFTHRMKIYIYHKIQLQCTYYDTKTKRLS